MGEAQRRKQLGLMPEKTQKPEQKARIKRDNEPLLFDPISAYTQGLALLSVAKQRKEQKG